MDTKLANNQEKFRNKISYCFSEIAVFVCMGTFLAAPCDIRSVDTRPVVCKRPLIAVVLSCLPGFYMRVLYPPLWPACLVLRCHVLRQTSVATLCCTHYCIRQVRSTLVVCFAKLTALVCASLIINSVTCYMFDHVFARFIDLLCALNTWRIA